MDRISPQGHQQGFGSTAYVVQWILFAPALYPEGPVIGASLFGHIIVAVRHVVVGREVATQPYPNAILDDVVVSRTDKLPAAHRANTQLSEPPIYCGLGICGPNT